MVLEFPKKVTAHQTENIILKSKMVESGFLTVWRLDEWRQKLPTSHKHLIIMLILYRVNICCFSQLYGPANKILIVLNDVKITLILTRGSPILYRLHISYDFKIAPNLLKILSSHRHDLIIFLSRYYYLVLSRVDPDIWARSGN